MALIECPECKKQVSDHAVSCPKCGYPIQKELNKEIKKATQTKQPSFDKYLWVTGIIVAVVCIFIFTASGQKKSGHATQYSYTSSPSYTYSYTPKTGNEGALEKAKSYLNSSAFSYEGLVEQLEFSGFSHSEAVYGADKCGANWNEQALRSAKSYLTSSAFSYTGLREQLEFTGFTQSEAKYGADNCGANWNEQAAKQAASYLRSSSFTKSELIDQLEFSGFTHSEAVYGVNQSY